MKRALPFIFFIAFLSLAVFIWFRNTANDKTNEAEKIPAVIQNGEIQIKMTAAGFDPQKISVKVGTRVVFINNNTESHWPASAIHPTHEIYPEFDAKKAIPPRESWTFQFMQKGVWRYHDHLSPAKSGTITVE